MRKNVIIFFIVLTVIIFQVPSYPWGGKVHYAITRRGCEILSNYLGDNFPSYSEYISNNSNLPDIWKGYYNREGYGFSESPNHYCDYDFYQRLKRGDLNKDFKDIKKEYSFEELRKGGTVIWAIEDYSILLKSAFENKDFHSVLIYIAVLAHYIEDIHQPLHATENYDGQLTGNTGIHLRYEIFMMNRFWTEPSLKKIDKLNLIKMKDIRGFTISIIEDSLCNVQVLLDADTKAKKVDKRFSNEYYKILWEETKEVTESRTNTAVENFAVLIYSIWVESGKPEFPDKENFSVPYNLEIERVVFFDDNKTESTAKTRKDEKRSLIYSILTIAIFYSLIKIAK